MNERSITRVDLCNYGEKVKQFCLQGEQDVAFLVLFLSCVVTFAAIQRHS
jgi:hypothetical protein